MRVSKKIRLSFSNSLYQEYHANECYSDVKNNRELYRSTYTKENWKISLNQPHFISVSAPKSPYGIIHLKKPKDNDTNVNITRFRSIEILNFNSHSRFDKERH